MTDFEGQYDLAVRDAYLPSHDETVDIGIVDGRIATVGTVERSSVDEIDADGRLVSPGLVDAHAHFNMAFSAGSGRSPQANDETNTVGQNIQRVAEYMEETAQSTIRKSVRRGIESAITNGVLYGREHAYVDSTVGAKTAEAVLDVREALAPVFDLQVVAFPQKGYVADPGSIDATREALRLGADYVGGIDPGSVNQRIEETIECWLDLATSFDVGIDAHIHEHGSLGRFSISRLAQATIDAGYENRVTVSHAYALDADDATGGETADPETLPPTSLEHVLAKLQEAEIAIVTSYMTTPAGMPIRELNERSIPVGHGNDHFQDLWFTQGNGNVMQGALVEAFTLSREQLSKGHTAHYTTNPGLQQLWDLITRDSAAVLGIEDYGIEVGTPADLVVHGAQSPEWVLIEQPTPEYVISDGEIVAADGSLTTSLS